jgi:hypothetical protein
VQIRDLKIQEEASDLVIGTFGRAIWVVDNINPLRELAAAGPQDTLGPLHVFTIPPAYQASYRSVDGIRFTADAEFRGDNKPSGADIRVWVRDEKQVSEETEKETGKNAEQDAKKEDDKKSWITVLDMEGDTVRRYSVKLKPGMNTLHWNLRGEGVSYPTRRVIEDEHHTPSGSEVLPGTYTIICSNAEHVDSTSLQIRQDPRIPVSLSGLSEKRAMADELQGWISMAFDAFEALKKAKTQVELVGENLKYAPDSVLTTIEGLNKVMSGRIDTLENLFMLPSDSEGYRDSEDKLNSILSTASTYISSSVGKPGTNAEIALSRAKAKTNTVVSRVNNFLETDWSEYRQTIEGFSLQMFDEIPLIEAKE